MAYKPGHVEYILGDILCVVHSSAEDHPIEILHASLFDFFLDKARANYLFINPARAHEMIALGYYRSYVKGQGRLVC